jgi:hypothetical protein
MSMEELATALASIRAVTMERDGLRNSLAAAERSRDQWKDRCDLVQVKLENAERDAKMYMRTAAAYAERINAIGLLADDAKEAVKAAVAEGILTVTPAPDAPIQANAEGGVTVRTIPDEQ